MREYHAIVLTLLLYAKVLVHSGEVQSHTKKDDKTASESFLVNSKVVFYSITP